MPASLIEIYKMVGSLQLDVTNATRPIEAQDSRSTANRQRFYENRFALIFAMWKVSHPFKPSGRSHFPRLN